MSESEDLMREARDLTSHYRDIADGHHSRLRIFLQDTYALHLRFRDNAGEFSELRRHPFWERSRQKPKPTTSRWLLLFVTRAASDNERSRIGKYAAVLDFFTEMKLPDNCVAEAIEHIGGVDAAHRTALRMRRMRLVPEPEERLGDAGTDLAVAKPNSRAAAGVSFADVAAVELLVAGQTDESAVLSRLTKILADPSIVGFEEESPPKKRGRPFSLDSSIVLEEVLAPDHEEIIGGARWNSLVRRYAFIVDVLRYDPLRDWVPVKVISIMRRENYARSE